MSRTFLGPARSRLVFRLRAWSFLTSLLIPGLDQVLNETYIGVWMFDSLVRESNYGLFSICSFQGTDRDLMPLGNGVRELWALANHQFYQMIRSLKGLVSNM